ncbi:hypothetical protein NE237_010201 [Protea cynaroides]|uniref:WRKY domain-containing protein n=1 Tax=Protea cynaroides TaxID=273540 RepID=A0A9Q0KZA2_9MAGN|nr:hypothetical protein NE237_010201 [Protea cynaroides]
MESRVARNLSLVPENVTEEIFRGRGYAAQLQIVLRELTRSGQVTATAEDLVTKISRSFTEALSPLSCCESGKVPVSSDCQLDLSKKRSTRRKMQETWTRITDMPIEDGYTWRKYGQKEIQNAKHLRSYFRCTYRFDSGCEATKQVQRIEANSTKFQTKYIGHHTCQDALKSSFVAMDDSIVEEGYLLNFETKTLPKQDPLFFSFFPSIKQSEYNPSCSEYLPPQDLTKFKSSVATTEPLPSASQSSHGYDISDHTTSSSSSFDMDLELMDYVYLNDVFLFNDEELPKT